MKRFAPALVALLALIALATAAGSLDAVDTVSVTGDSDPDLQERRAAGGSSSQAPTGTESVGSADAGDSETPAGGGVSPLVGGGLVAALLVVGILVVVLTDDDARAPPREDGPTGRDGSPLPAVDPGYDTPETNAVVRAWRRFADRVDTDESATPRETAASAADRGVPPDAARELAGQFDAVRYGRRLPTAERERRAERVLDPLERGRDDREGSGDTDDRSGGESA